MKFSKLKKLTNKKLAVISLDFEEDYGGRVNQFNIIKMEKELKDLSNLCSKLQFGISTFIQTNLIEKSNETLDLVRLISNDFHAHTHTHNVNNFDNEKEILTCFEVFNKKFNYSPIGYRAPQGVLTKLDITLLKKAGFKFSSSIITSFRPGKYNNLNFPQEPVQYENGIIEMPIASTPIIKIPISISYLKLTSLTFNKIFIKLGKLPNILIINSHLHDLIINDTSYNKLPGLYILIVIR